MKREFLQLAKEYNPEKHYVGGWFASEKLDGMRAFWDGGISRGLLTTEIPWASDKTVRMATGLWSRYGKVISAPDWWVDKLPTIPLDGELWCGHNKRQLLMSIVKQHTPDGRWQHVEYWVFDTPFLGTVFSDGHINNTNYNKVFKGIDDWIKDRNYQRLVQLMPCEFRIVGPQLEMLCRDTGVKCVKQIEIPKTASYKFIVDLITDVKSHGGEGLILRSPTSLWTPARVWDCLKVKTPSDAEATVIGYYWGRETDKGSKLLGLMGSMLVEWGGVRFRLSGFTESERTMTYVGNNETAATEGAQNEGEYVSPLIHNPKFPRGSTVTFTYHGLTSDGVPVEARYLRQYEEI